MKKQLLVLLALAFVITLSACGSEEATVDQEAVVEHTKGAASESEVTEEVSLEDEVEQLLLDYIDYSQNEDIDGYMSLLIDAHQFEQTRDLLARIFDAYDLEYTLDSHEIVSRNHDDSQVVVKVVLTTVAASIAEGFEFSDNQLTVKHTLLRENGKLKFSTSEVIELVELN